MQKSINQKRIAYIKANKDLSQNQIMRDFSKQGIGIQRQKGHDLIRDVRGEQKKSNVKKYIPIKYRKVEVEVISLKRHPSRYKLSVVKDVRNNKKYFVKHDGKAGRKSFMDQIREIVNTKDYNVKNSDLKLISRESVDYKGEFITSEAEKVLER